MNLNSYKHENEVSKTLTGDPKNLGHKGKASGGTVALCDSLKQALDLLWRVDDGVFADVQIVGLRSVDLQHPEEPLVPIAPNQVKPLIQCTIK